jgi:site-specific recombinase XerD
MKMRTDREAIIELRAKQLKVGHRLNTRKSYRGWMLRYRKARRDGVCGDLQGFLTYLATDAGGRVNPKTVRQALNALKFYHEKVLGIEIAPNSLRVPAINSNRNVPVWLTHEEAMELISRLDGVERLQAELLYGTGSRITALLTLRLKDLDLQKGLVVFRHDKGGKSRTVRLPRAAMHRLMTHVASVRLQWESDRARGVTYPTEQPEEMKKLGRKRYGTLPFCWLFPSAVVRHGKEGMERWQATDHALTAGLKQAAEEAGILKRVSPHVFRHSNATALLERGVNIRRLQEHLGHTKVETTEIYTHATATAGVISPMDLPPVAEVSFPGPVMVPFPSRQSA